MAGVDTKQERDVIDFRPDLSRVLDDVITQKFEDISGQPFGYEELSDSDKIDKEIQDYLDMIAEIDALFAALFKLLQEQQKDLSIAVDTQSEPTISEALLYLTDGEQGNVISYEVWRKAQNILENGYFRTLGGDPLKINDVDAARRVADAIKKVDNINMIAIAWRALKASVYKSIAKIIPNAQPFKPLRNKFMRQARKAEENPIADLGLSNLQGDDEERDSIPQYPELTTGQLPVAVGAAARAETVSKRVMEVALVSGNPFGHSYNPNAFILNTAINNMHRLHKTNKAILHYAGYAVPNAAEDKLKEWGGAVWGNSGALSQLYSKAPKGLALALARSQPGQLRDALDNTILNLTAWTHGITAKCSFIRSLAGLGKADLRMLYGIKLLIAWKAGQADEALEDIANAGVVFANTILMGLVAKAMTPLQVAYESWLLEWHNAAKSSLGVDIQNCAQFDEFLDEIYGFMDQLGDELTGMIGSYVDQLQISVIDFGNQNRQSSQKMKLEGMLWMIDEIIKALENAELCQDNDLTMPQGVNLGTLSSPDMRPTVDDVAGFLTNRNIQGSSTLNKALDKTPGLTVGKKEFIPSETSDELLAVLSNCSAGPSNATILDLKAKLAKRLNNGDNS